YRHGHHSQRRVQKGLGRIFPQLLQGQKARKEIRGLGRLAAEDIVHSDLDDLRRQGVKSHTQAGAEQRRHKKAHHGLEKPPDERRLLPAGQLPLRDRKSTRLNSSHVSISYAVFCLKNKRAFDFFTPAFCTAWSMLTCGSRTS